MAQIIKKGILHKAPPKDKLKNKFAEKWKLRWFILWSNKNLEYFEDSICSRSKGGIPLDKVDTQDIRHALVLEKRNWVIAINVKAQNREYYLAADDEEAMVSWVKALKEALKVDYILASEIASSNLMCSPYKESDSSDSTCEQNPRYVQILPDGLERIITDESNITDVDESPEVIFELDTNRQSTVSPYEVYDQDSIKIGNQNIYELEKSNSEEVLTNENTEHYMPMKVLNSISDIDGEEPQPCTPDPKSPDSTSMTGDNAFESNNEHIQCFITSFFSEQENIPEGNEFRQVKPSASSEIYEMMNTPPANEPEIIHAYDHLNEACVHFEETLQRLENDQISNQENRVKSNDYDDILNFKAMNNVDDESPVLVRPIRSFTDIPVDSILLLEPPKLPPKGSGIGLKEEFRKSVYGQFQNLLETYWIMYISLPNKFVVKELVNIECPVDNLIQKLSKLFTGHKYQHDFNLYVVSDVHQTFENLKKTEKDNAKNDRRLNNDMSFINQGISSAKLLQLVSIKGIDQHIFNQYLRDREELSYVQRFCETWIPFVRGYFSIPDLREVATLSGYVHYVYQSTFTSKSISHDIFLPKNARDVSECVKKVREQSLELKETPIQTACSNFMKRLAVWPTANTVAFPIKRIGKGMIMNKQSDLLIVFANDHIGIVKADKNTDYSNFIYWWHKLDIGSFCINGKENLVIKLTKPIDEGSCEFQIKSSMNKIMCQLLENFSGEMKMPLNKRVSLGAMTVKNVRKPLPDIPADDN